MKECIAVGRIIARSTVESRLVPITKGEMVSYVGPTKGGHTVICKGRRLIVDSFGFKRLQLINKSIAND